jgi:hypothetical protein
MNPAFPPDSAVVANWSASDWLMSAAVSEKPQIYQYDKGDKTSPDRGLV